MSKPRVDVACAREQDGWICGVRVADDSHWTAHEVVVPAESATRLGQDPSPGTHDIERLVQETFDFLLEREPKESILARFEIDVVARYFPEYEGEIRRRLGH
jgi:hypothetical protein